MNIWKVCRWKGATYLRLNVRQRVIGAVLIIALMCLELGLAGQFALQMHTNTYRDLVKQARRHDVLIAANLGVQKMFCLLRDFQDGDASNQAECRTLAPAVAHKLKALEGFPWKPASAKVLRQVQQEFDVFRKHAQTILDRKGKVDLTTLAWRRRLIGRSLDTLLREDTIAQWSQWDAMYDAQVKVGWIFTICFIVVVCGAVIVSHVLARSITRPIEAITRATEHISEGDLSTRILVQSKDELGQLAERFNFMMSELETLFVSTVDALAAAVDAKSPWTAGHSHRVTQYALDTAQQMNLDPRMMSVLKISGLLHDIGKVGVPDRILDKEKPLTDEEYEVMKEHPDKGYHIIASVRHLEPVLDGIRYHHERYDGKGYPSGLTAEEIPFIARILAVADAFDAMTSDRPYRPGMLEEKALRIFAEDDGKQWDVDVVDAFMRTRDPKLSKVKQSSDSLDLPVHLVASPPTSEMVESSV
jgi:HD-GYP domain-containing protein (c-di-GMP phosphodiesterase class II)